MTSYFLSIVLFFGCNLAAIQAGSHGMVIKAQGTFMKDPNRQKIVDLLVKNPKALLSDIDVAVEAVLLKKKKEHIESLAQKIDQDKKEKAKSSLKNIRRILDQGIGFFHESYGEADTIRELLEKNPRLIGAILGTHAETEQYYPKSSFAYAFDWLSYLTFASLNYDQYNQLREQYNNVPFFRLIQSIRECFSCGISRIEVPFVREHLEDAVVNHIKNTIPDKNQQITITDFASGNAFQIFVTLNKLAAEGYKNIRLNLIDIEYEFLMKRYRALSNTNQVVLNQGAFDLTPDEIAAFVGLPQKRVLEANQDAHGEDIILEEPSQTEIDAGSAVTKIFIDTQLNAMLRTFIQWFNGTDVRLELVIYKDALDYLQDCAHDPSFKSDLLIAVDYFTELNSLLEKLRTQGLKETGKAFSIDHAEIEPGLKNAEFYYSEGSQKDPSMKHYEWDLTTKKLKPVDHLPQTLDYEVSLPHIWDLLRGNQAT